MYLSLISKGRFKIALMFSVLSGCGYSSSDQRDSIEFSALPIIQRAVATLVPMFGGQNNDLVMKVVCALAREQQSPEQISKIMKAQGVDLSAVPLQGHPLSLLVNKDPGERISACAAYVATSVMKIPSLNDIVTGYKEGVGAGDNSEKIDPIKLDQLLGRQLAIAKSNSDVYALIARELKKSPGKTLVQYDEQAKQLFKKIAPVYLRRVKTFAEMEQEQSHTLEELSNTTFKFKSGSGYRFELGYDGLYLSLNKSLWFGGNIMTGQKYQLKVNYFEPALLVFPKE